MQIDHIPFKLPNKSYSLSQEWRYLTFLHWIVDSKNIRPYLPDNLELDTYNGKAYVSTIPFLMKNVRPRFLPSIYGISTFPEFNIRTYVKHKNKTGVFFLTLDAQSIITCLFAPYAYGLPYRYSSGRIESIEKAYLWQSKRLSDQVEIKGQCKPLGKSMRAAKGSIEEFLFERYCLFTLHKKKLCMAYVAHKPWIFKSGDSQLNINSLTESYNLGIKNSLKPDLVHISNGVKVKTWPLEEVK
jgi:hypothetical protein